MTSVSIDDFEALQGAWEQTALEDNGVLNPTDEHSAPGAITTISGDQFQVVTVDGEVLLAGSFTLDASTAPKSITWVDAIVSLLSILYILDAMPARIRFASSR